MEPILVFLRPLGLRLGLSDAEIEKMIKDAEANKTVDEKKKKDNETKYRAETFIHSMKKELN